MPAHRPVIAPLERGDIPRANELLGRAFGVAPVFAGRLERYLALSPAFWLGLRDENDDTLLGVVGANVFEGSAYIGLMGIDPRAQRQGLGQHLMQELLARLARADAQVLMLDASSLGEPLYARLGFRPAGFAEEWTRLGADEGKSLLPGSTSLLVVTVEDDDARAQVAALDAELFGFDRGRLWERLEEERRSRPEQVTLWAARTSDRALVGYLVLQAGVLAGPFGARSPDAAAALLAAALGQPAFRQSGRVLVPSSNPDALALLEASGFKKARALAHMRWTSPAVTPSRPLPAWRQLYGKGSFCLG